MQNPTENYTGVQQVNGNTEAEGNLENIKLFDLEKYVGVACGQNCQIIILLMTSTHMK